MDKKKNTNKQENLDNILLKLFKLQLEYLILLKLKI